MTSGVMDCSPTPAPAGSPIACRTRPIERRNLFFYNAGPALWRVERETKELKMTNFSRLLTMTAAALAVAGAAHAQTFVFTALLTGPAESPPNTSPGTGTSTVTVNMTLSTMRVQAMFSGLLGNLTVAHIHAPTAVAGTGTGGVATPTPSFSGFPAGTTSGSYDQTFDLTLASSYNAAFVTASGSISQAMSRLVLALQEGKAYLNLHSSQFPGGEIRGFYVPTPGAASAFVVAGLVASRRRRA